MLPRQAPSGRFVVRAFSPYPGTEWRRDWRERDPGDLLPKLPTIARAIRRAAPKIVKMVKEADRMREEELRRLEIQHREYRRQWHEEQKVSARKAAYRDLTLAIEHWSTIRNIEMFFEQVTETAENLSVDERESILERVNEARALIGNNDALERLRQWRTPRERYPDDGPPET
jgi:hypothetical protein